MAFRIFKADEFDKVLKKLDNSEQKRVDKILAQIAERGDEVGKPLSGPFFREKKFDGKRLYYLVYKDFSVVLALTIGDKKTQQATINTILLNLAQYQQHVIELLRKLGLL